MLKEKVKIVSFRFSIFNLRFSTPSVFCFCVCVFFRQPLVCVSLLFFETNFLEVSSGCFTAQQCKTLQLHELKSVRAYLYA